MGYIQPTPYVWLSWIQTTELKRPLNFGLKYDIVKPNFENKKNSDW